MLGINIKNIRLKKNLTQKELAGRAKISDHSVISDIERGKVADPGIQKIKAIANALNVSVEELIGAEPPKPKLDPELQRILDEIPPEMKAFIDIKHKITKEEAETVKNIIKMIIEKHKKNDTGDS